MTPDDLSDFSMNSANEFNAGHIRAPVHLSGGNERSLIAIFEAIRPQDWVLTTWRSHYHCLLKGVPPAELKAAIMAGRSIALCFPEHRIVSSAIVGGMCPVAVGIGMRIKNLALGDFVYCFLGDMAAETGIAHESIKYAYNHDLPVRWIIEDNGKSVMTPTRRAWGPPELRAMFTSNVVAYEYELPWPHAGAGRRVQF